jgi:hypothetical protein
MAVLIPGEQEPAEVARHTIEPRREHLAIHARQLAVQQGLPIL